MSSIVTIRKGIETADQIADFIANPDPSKPFANAIGNAGRKACESWSAQDPWTQGFLAQVIPGGIGQAGLLNTVCKPYLDDNGWDSPSQVPPFTGGQCYTTYNLDFSFTNQFGRQTSNQIVSGRIIGVYVTEVLGNGTKQSGIERETSPGAGITRISLGTVAGTIDPDPAIANIVRVDGLPDDCGDPPGVLAPGSNPAPSPGPFPTGEEPDVDPFGNPIFYVPDIADPFGDIPIGDDPFAPAPVSGGGDGLPGLDDAIGPEAADVESGDGEEIDFGEPPEGRVWVGCIVETTTDSKIGSIPGTGPGQRVWPDVRGNLSLKYGDRKGSNVRINSRFTDIYRPVTSLILTGAFLQLQPFSSGKIFPISALKCPDNPCGDT